MKTAEEILKKYDYDVIKRPRPKLMLAMQEYATQERQKAIQECIKKIDIDDREIRQAAEDRLNPYPSSPMDEFKRGMKEMRAIGVTELKKLKQK